MIIMKLTSNIMKSIFEARLAPEADYELMIDDVKVKNDIEIDKIDDKHGNLTIIVNFSILDNGYEGYKVKSIFSVFNPNNRNVALALRKSFSNMLLSAGVSEKEFENDFDTDTLAGKRIKAHVIIEPANDKFAPYNRATYFIN